MMNIMSTNKITDYDIQALIDNELEWEDQKNVLDHIENDLEASKRYKELKAQKELINRWYRSKT